MNTASQIFQRRYHGFCMTPSLWVNSKLLSIKSFELNGEYSSKFLRKLNKKRRLGQLAEQFVFNQIETHNDAELLAENIQIQHNKNTLGELDALILFDGKPIHLEIIYKFYVYDDSISNSEIGCWIGPNRKDSLIEKLDKLKEKQLPLLYSEDCKFTLETLELTQHNFEQRAFFKAQLFVPYLKSVEFTQLNSDCVYGFYLHTHQLENFKTCEFFIPEKLDWFIKPHRNVYWIDFKEFKNLSAEYLNKSQSPLFWIKDNNQLMKSFLVWW